MIPQLLMGKIPCTGMSGMQTKGNSMLSPEVMIKKDCVLIEQVHSTIET